MKKFLSALVLLGLIGGIAYAQSIVLPTVSTINYANDRVQVIPGGQPGAQSVYVPPQEVTATSGYIKAAVPVGSASTLNPGYINYFGSYQSLFLLEPAATQATATFYLSALPSDGTTNCMFSIATVTSATINGLNSQTVSNGITAMTANTRYCYTYSASNTTWDRSQ